MSCGRILNTEQTRVVFCRYVFGERKKLFFTIILKYCVCSRLFTGSGSSSSSGLLESFSGSYGLTEAKIVGVNMKGQYIWGTKIGFKRAETLKS